MTRRRSVHETIRFDAETATGAPGWITVDVRVFFPPDASPGLVAELLREVVGRVVATLDKRPVETVHLPDP